jgi:glycosyltransferase involved in cell wall biosynthesis
VRQVVQDQVARGFTVAVACPPQSATVEGIVEAGATLLPWDARRAPGVSVVGETRRLGRIVAAFEPDVVHLHSSKAGLAGRLALRGRRPTVFQPNGWSFDAVEGLVRRGSAAWERVGARWASAIVCVSEGERARGEQVGIRARWRVVVNGVDLERFSLATDADRTAAREQLGLGPEPLAACIGRLSTQKGQDVLLDAWPSVRERVPEAVVALVGEGPARAELERRSVPGVLFPGLRKDVADWLAAADIVVLPSRWEGMAFTMLEAMARGRSVVTTAVAGAREAVEGGAGAVVPIEDPRALADVIAVRLSDARLAAAEGTMARRRAEERYDLRRATGALADLYRELLG